MGNQTSRYGMNFKADTERSTYRWIIYFNNGKHIYGYSKKENEPEIQDHVKLLKRKIIMLAQKNYFDPKNVQYIEFYKRTSIGQYKNHLVDLHPTQYVLKSCQEFNQHQNMIEFLNTIYDLIKVGNIGQISYSMVGYSKISEEKLFDTSRVFQDISELQKFCNDRLIEGWPFGKVDAFRHKILEKFTTINFKTA